MKLVRKISLRRLEYRDGLYDLYIDGVSVGSAKSYHQAEISLDEYELDMLFADTVRVSQPEDANGYKTTGCDIEAPTGSAG